MKINIYIWLSLLESNNWKLYKKKEMKWNYKLDKIESVGPSHCMKIRMPCANIDIMYKHWCCKLIMILSKCLHCESKTVWNQMRTFCVSKDIR